MCIIDKGFIEQIKKSIFVTDFVSMYMSKNVHFSDYT